MDTFERSGPAPSRHRSLAHLQEVAWRAADDRRAVLSVRRAGGRARLVHARPRVCRARPVRPSSAASPADFSTSGPGCATRACPDCYPDHYPRHQEPSPRIPFKGSGARVSGRYAGRSRPRTSATRPFLDARAGLLHAASRAVVGAPAAMGLPALAGRGRYLDVGCGSGASLGAATALGWQVSGIEADAAAAREGATLHGSEITRATCSSAPFGIGVLRRRQRVPRAGARARSGRGRAPDARVAGAGRARDHRGAECGRPRRVPVRHARGQVSSCRAISPTSRRTVSRRAVERAGGRIVWCWHQAKPRYYLWSLGHWLARPRVAIARAVRRVAAGLRRAEADAGGRAAVLSRWARRGEVIRVGVVKDSGG